MVLKLTRAEAQWLSRNIVKTKVILEAAARKDPETLERKTYRTVAALEADANRVIQELQDDSRQAFELKLEKESLKKVLKMMVEATIKSLETVIIPEYARRGAAFDEYREDTIRKVALLNKLRKKIR